MERIHFSGWSWWSGRPRLLSKDSLQVHTIFIRCTSTTDNRSVSLSLWCSSPLTPKFSWPFNLEAKRGWSCRNWLTTTHHFHGKFCWSNSRVLFFATVANNHGCKVLPQEYDGLGCRIHLSDFLCFNWGGAYSSFSCLEEPLVIKHLHIPHSGMFTQA